MTTYRFSAFQHMEGYYKGYIEIQAKDPIEAKKLIKEMTQGQLEDQSFEWRMADDFIEVSEIDVDTESLHEIKDGLCN